MKTLREILGLKKPEEKEKMKTEKSTVRTILLGKTGFSPEKYIAYGCKVKFQGEDWEDYRTRKSISELADLMTTEILLSSYETIYFQNFDGLIVQGTSLNYAGHNDYYRFSEIIPLGIEEMNEFKRVIKNKIDKK